MWCILKRERNLELGSVGCGFVSCVSFVMFYFVSMVVRPWHILKQPYRLPKKMSKYCTKYTSPLTAFTANFEITGINYSCEIQYYLGYVLQFAWSTISPLMWHTSSEDQLVETFGLKFFFCLKISTNCHAEL